MAQARSSRDELALPNQRAFLIRYSAASNLEGGDVSGRVEHVDSGHATRFRSREELERFIIGVLRELAQDGREK